MNLPGRARYAAAALVPALLAGCATTPPPPIHYIAVRMPADIQPRSAGATQTISRNRFGVLYRPPLDLVEGLQELSGIGKSPVLMDADAQLAVPFCVIVVCFGTDSISAATAGPTAAFTPSVAVAPPPPPPPLPDELPPDGPPPDESGAPAEAPPTATTAEAAPPAAEAPPAPAAPAPRPPPEAAPTRGRSRGPVSLADRPMNSGVRNQPLPAGAELELVNAVRNASGKWWYVRAAGKSGWLKEEEIELGR